MTKQSRWKLNGVKALKHFYTYSLNTCYREHLNKVSMKNDEIKKIKYNNVWCIYLKLKEDCFTVRDKSDVYTLSLYLRHWYDGAEWRFLHTVRPPAPPPHWLASLHSPVTVRPVISAHSFWTFYFSGLKLKLSYVSACVFGLEGVKSEKVVALQGSEGFVFFNIINTERVFF